MRWKQLVLVSQPMTDTVSETQRWATEVLPRSKMKWYSDVHNTQDGLSDNDYKWGFIPWNCDLGLFFNQCPHSWFQMIRPQVGLTQMTFMANPTSAFSSCEIRQDQLEARLPLGRLREIWGPLESNGPGPLLSNSIGMASQHLYSLWTLVSPDFVVCCSPKRHQTMLWHHNA